MEIASKWLHLLAQCKCPWPQELELGLVDGTGPAYSITTASCVELH